MKVPPVAGIYISWPFCAQKCTYCNFASGVLPKKLEAEYADALCEEIARHEWKWVPETLYLGGGTPGSMDPDVLRRLVGGKMEASFPEATMEAAPGTLSAERIDAWRRVGINRVSLGVQSFIRAELARTGRRHDAEGVARDVEMLRAGGISNLNLDLIAGLPGQNETGWRESLEWIRRLDPPHVSVYMLEVDDDSRLGSEILLGGKRYGAMDVPSDDATADFYEMAVEALAGMGIERYEISNFARPGSESLHNLKYWRRAPYVGFGADAHSFDGEKRWQNTEAAADYVARIQRGESPRCETSTPDEAEEKFFVGLRLSSGVKTNTADWERFGNVFNRFLEPGFLVRTGDRIALSKRGVMISNEIFQEFIHT